MRRVKKSVSVVLDMNAGNVIVTVDGCEVSKAEFHIDGTQIMVTDVGTNEKYQHSGYGRLVFDVLKCLSNQKKLPLILWSLDEAIPFYEKVGMLHLNDPEVQKRIIFLNVKDGDLSEKIDEDDFIWIPQSLNRRKPAINM